MSFLYRSATLYGITMKLIYGGAYRERYEAVSRFIPENSSVIDVCCGDCRLYADYLAKKHVDYLGLDASSNFEKSAKNARINFKKISLEEFEMPLSDYIVMMASLYQFIPNHKTIMRKLIAATGKKLIIVEPVRNLAQSKNPVIKAFAKITTYPQYERFDKEKFWQLCDEFGAVEKTEICNGRDGLGVFERK